jgi:hypothetical protein
MRKSTLLCAPAIVSVLVLAAGCGPKVDVKKDLAIVDVTTGWFDAGIVKTANGDENKIVPTVAFKIKNVSDKTVANVMVDVVFHQITEPNTDWGTSWVKGIGGEGLAPGETTPEIVLRSERGYTSLQPRLQMLQNRVFVDAIVDVLLKQGANKYVRMQQIKIDRQLLTQ